MTESAVYFAFLFGIAVCAAVVKSEYVWLEDVNNDHNKRNLDLGLPSSLSFNLRRGKAKIPLQLEENTRLNQNADVYEVSESGELLQTALPTKLHDTRFYLDKVNGGHFAVRCSRNSNGPCRRSMYGNLYIDNINYDINPAEENLATRELYGGQDDIGLPHVLTEIPSEPTPTTEDDPDDYAYPDDPRPDHTGKKRAQTVGKVDKLLEDLKGKLAARLLSSKFDRKELERLLKEERSKRAATAYGVELLIVTDAALWDRFYSTTSATATLSREEETERAIREYISHVVNGMDLRYESIEAADFSLYLTIRAFIIIKQRSSSDPLPLGSETSSDGVDYADVNDYLYSLQSWVSEYSLPENDHVMVFTGLELYSGSISNKGVAGKAFVGAVCGPYKVSVNEVDGFYTTIAVAGHELGHNLGSPHDGSGGSSACPNSQYMMSPMVPQFYNVQDYNINPWRFSSCSVEAFRQMINQLNSGGSNCLADQATVYDALEWSQHMQHLPGQIYPASEQCKLLEGESSNLCSWTNMDNICLTMMCQISGSNSCRYYSAARGTQCGTSGDKWCIEGQCVDKTTLPTKNLPEENNAEVTTKAVTAPPPTTQNQNPSGSFGGCVDRGYDTLSCDDLREANFNSNSYMCKYFYPECCSTCASVYRYDGSVTLNGVKHTCPELVSNVYKGSTAAMCSRFGYVCGKTCGEM